ncbi:hypothetical protein [Nereida sp. MMG025]|uniref:hypothetical protein n=1 Tax=Nereida sp. MMG025 TaxID=2909981 RepID=UPI001F1D0188|nr:hypothetical protein [Nereida sp. MMG025]MCF6445489.1 hypothetical protein [Nereida sp. MMG025]
MALLEAKDYDNLPTEPIEKWLQLRDTIEKRLANYYDQQTADFVFDAKVEYTETLNALSTELGLGVIIDSSYGNIDEDFPSIKAQVAATAARWNIRARNAPYNGILVVSEPVKERIEVEIERLKKAIRDSDLEAEKKEMALNKLDELIADLAKKSIAYSDLMKTLAFVAMGLGGTTAFLADAPDAIATIMQVIGLQQEASEKHQSLIEGFNNPPVPQLPAPPKLLVAPTET